MGISFPIDCNAPRRKIEFCFRTRELLRLLHNKMGYWYRPDNPPITQTQYDNNFPSPKFDRLRNKYPFAPKLTQAQWDAFQVNVYEKIDNKINLALANNAQALMNTSEWAPDLDGMM